MPYIHWMIDTSGGLDSGCCGSQGCEKKTACGH